LNQADAVFFTYLLCLLSSSSSLLLLSFVVVVVAAVTVVVVVVLVCSVCDKQPDRASGRKNYLIVRAVFNFGADFFCEEERRLHVGHDTSAIIRCAHILLIYCALCLAN